MARLGRTKKLKEEKIEETLIIAEENKEVVKEEVKEEVKEISHKIEMQSLADFLF